MTMLKVSNEIFPKSLFCIINKFFFLSSFSFADTDESQESRGNGVDRLNSFITEVSIMKELIPLATHSQSLKDLSEMSSFCLFLSKFSKTEAALQRCS